MNCCTKMQIRFACVIWLTVTSIFLNCKADSIHENKFPIVTAVIFLPNVYLFLLQSPLFVLFGNSSSSDVQWNS